MSNKKLQVFVSSTFTDLVNERQAAVQAILKAGHIPAGMELFKAGDEEQMEVIKRWIDESDVYMLILGGRYGSVDEKSGKSYTQLEYEYALAQGKALFAVVVNEPTLEKWLKEYGYEKIEKYYTKELEHFRNEVLKEKVVAFWDDAKDIKMSILETLPEFQRRESLVGWVKSDNVINTGVVAEELARLSKENKELKGKLFENNSSVFYSTLTYTQLEKLMKNNICDFYQDKISLFEFLLEYGHNWNKVFRQDDFIMNVFGKNRFMDYRESVENILDLLANFKILKQLSDYVYEFTQDGHNFYLKTLALQNEEFNS